MALKPLGDRVIIKRDEAETVTSSGLFIATSSTAEKPQTGVVISVGEGKLDKDGKLIPVPVKAGDKVLYGKYGGTEITVDGEEVLIVRVEDIYAIFE